jgi:hypothetical protein
MSRRIHNQDMLPTRNTNIGILVLRDCILQLEAKLSVLLECIDAPLLDNCYTVYGCCYARLGHPHLPVYNDFLVRLPRILHCRCCKPRLESSAQAAEKPSIQSGETRVLDHDTSRNSSRVAGVLSSGIGRKRQNTCFLKSDEG